MYKRQGYISYANCGLPYYIGDAITDPEELTLQTPESFFSRFRIMMKVLHEAVSYTHLDVYKRQIQICVDSPLHNLTELFGLNHIRSTINRYLFFLSLIHISFIIASGKKFGRGGSGTSSA